MAKRKVVREVYAPTPGGVLSAEQAVIAGTELARISEKHGCIKPQAVVEESRPKSAPLHNHFTWDDTEAASQYRLHEARMIIRSVRVIRDDMPAAEQRVVRAFLNVTAHDKETKFTGRAYVPIYVVRKSTRYKQQVLDDAKRELLEWKRKYEDLEEYLATVFDAIEQTVER